MAAAEPLQPSAQITSEGEISPGRTVGNEQRCSRSAASREVDCSSVVEPGSGPHSSAYVNKAVKQLITDL